MPTWSNIVLTALLPYVSDFAARVQLPNPQPITQSQVLVCLPDTERRVEGFIMLTNGYRFWFERGHIWLFYAPTAFNDVQDPKLIPRYYGEVHLNKTQAIAAARDTLKRLGYNEKMLYADFEPKVVLPPKVDGHTVARYQVEWESPNRSYTSVSIEIDATTGKPLSIRLVDNSLNKADPVVDGVPPPDLKPRSSMQPISEDIEKAQIAQSLRTPVNDLIKRLQLACEEIGPDTKLEVSGYQRRGDVLGVAQLTNHFEFTPEQGSPVL
jgi:hypothetical protein